MKYYIMYSFPSGGTRFLQELLKKFGLGTGTFFRDTIKMAKDKEDIDRYFKESIRNDVWGSTIHWHMQIKLALKIIYPDQNVHSNPMKFLNRLCPGVKFIYLTRLNKLQQAISWTRAENIGTHLKATGDAPEDYSNEDILKMMNFFNFRESLAQDFFEENNIKPLYITYEELCDDKIKVARRVLQFLEIPEKPGHGEVISKKRFPQRKHCDVRDVLYRRMQKFISSGRI